MMVRLKRPTEFVEEIGVDVLSRLGAGETLKSICNSPSMPSQDTVRSWVRAEFHAPKTWALMYAHARHDQADGFAADIIEIADTVDEVALVAAQCAVDNLPDDATPTEKRRAFFFAKKRSVEGAKLAIDARKWIAARQNPRRWGDKVLLEHAIHDTTDGGIDLNSLSTADLEAVDALERKLNGTNAIDVDFTSETDNVNMKEVKEIQSGVPS